MKGYGQDIGEWELEKDKKGIKVYTRAQEGWPIKGFRAETSIKSSKEDFIQTVLNADAFTEWMKDMKSSKNIEVTDNDTVITYYVIDIPWPMQDRDAVGTMSRREEDNTTFIEVSILNDYLPEYPKLVRMKRSLGYWSVTETSENNLDIVYQFIADPEGNVPGWIANLFLVDGPYETLANLRDRLEQ